MRTTSKRSQTKPTGPRKSASRPEQQTGPKSPESASVPQGSQEIEAHLPGLRPASKQARLADLMHQPEGASVDELCQALGWQPHTVRAAITGLRKRGYVVTTSKRQNGLSAYHARIPEEGPQPGPGAAVQEEA